MPFIKKADGAYLNDFGTFGKATNKTHFDDATIAEIWCQKPKILFSFLIICKGHLAGFITIARAPYLYPPADYRINDFFVLNKFRRNGIGKEVLNLIFKEFHGKWEVSWIKENTVAECFWKKVIHNYSKGNCNETFEKEKGFGNLPKLIFTIK
jgi:predicted acetyltransferase